MSSVICTVMKEIEIGAIEKELLPKAKGGTRYFIGKDSKVIPYGTLSIGDNVQLRHGFEHNGEQRIYIASRKISGWIITRNQEGYSLNEIFKPVRKNRSPWEALH